MSISKSDDHQNASCSRPWSYDIESLNSTYRPLHNHRSQNTSDAPVKLLTPFDNILRERALPKRIWNFDYKIECYVPAPDRVYGYFVLPILDRTDLAGRLDAKVHRKTGVLEIKALYLENKELKSSQGLDRLKRGIVDFADFHSCEMIEVGKVRPRNLTRKIRSQFE